MLEQLKHQVLEANRDLVTYGLVTLTWGNVSGIDREQEYIVIKPSGVDYDALTIDSMVVLDLSGKVIEGNLRPSSDAPTHVELYKAFPSIGGIAHSHSIYASSFAQARREIPCVGTTHADAFNGPIPLTRLLKKREVEEDYERNTGKAIIERFKKLDPDGMPAVLVTGHAPFTWGRNASDAAKNNVMLEQIAMMALRSLEINPQLKPLPAYIIDKHHQRKHGPDAYYGQKK